MSEGHTLTIVLPISDELIEFSPREAARAAAAMAVKEANRAVWERHAEIVNEGDSE